VSAKFVDIEESASERLNKYRCCLVVVAWNIFLVEMGMFYLKAFISSYMGSWIYIKKSLLF